MKSKPVKVGLRTIKTVLSAFLCFLIDSLRASSVPFYAVIASILCIQPDMENSLSVAKNRELSTIIGGILGMLFLLMERIFLPIQPEILRELTLSILLIPIINLSVLLKQKKGTFLTCVVFLCVTVIHEKDISPIWFAWNRIVDTSLGIGISLAVNSFPFHKFKVGGTMGKY
ncbi:FUSC family protein [Clostridioides difficile]|nr:FUSC family protein [Clostridioides difficile]